MDGFWGVRIHLGIAVFGFGQQCSAFYTSKVMTTDDDIFVHEQSISAHVPLPSCLLELQK